jgi:excisionase family DNA binding protein
MSAEEIFTADEIAKRLKVSKAAVRRWTREGMPCLRFGERLVRFELASTLSWLQSRKDAHGRVGEPSE